MQGITKGEVKRLLVEQRKTMRAGRIKKSDVDRIVVEAKKELRAAHKESKFKARTLSIYRNQVRRAEELGKKLNYTLEEYRVHVRETIAGGCEYCRCKLTVGKFSNDHPTPVSREGEFVLPNTVLCCAPCNFQKGNMTAVEFTVFNAFLEAHLPADIVRDVRARLTTGGKWLNRPSFG